MVLAGIKVLDTVLVRDAIDLSRGASEPFLFNHVMRSWLFGVLLSESAERAPDAELLAVATILHDLGLTDRYTAENRFEVDGANAARSFLKGRGISTQQMQVVWDAIALHTTRSIALHKEPEVAMTHSGITADVLGAGLDRIPQDKQGAILAEFPRLALKNGLKECLCNIARRKPESTFDNIVRDFGVRYVEGYTSPNFADVVANHKLRINLVDFLGDQTVLHRPLGIILQVKADRAQLLQLLRVRTHRCNRRLVTLRRSEYA